MSLSGACQCDVANVFHKKTKVLLDGVTISYTKNMLNNSYMHLYNHISYVTKTKYLALVETKRKMGDQMKAIDGTDTICLSITSESFHYRHFKQTVTYMCE